MATLVFSNNAQAVLGAAVAVTDTTIQLATGSGEQFPNPQAGQYFVGTLRDKLTGLIVEIVWVTVRDADTLTVTRAQENTTAVAWLAGDTFGNFWTAGQAQTQGSLGITQDQLTAAVATEAQTRATADQANASAISLETFDRTAADQQLQAEILALQEAGGGGSGGGTIILPQNAVFLGTDANGNPITRTAGAQIVVSGGVVSFTRTGLPINLHGFIPSLPNVALPQTLLTLDIGLGEASAVPANLASSVNKANAAATASYSITVSQNGTAVATITFSAGGTTATATTVSNTGFSTSTGDVIQFTGPATPDATLAGIRLNIYGTAR